MMDQKAAEPEVIHRATMRDEDSSLFLQIIREPEGNTSVAMWGTEDHDPDTAVAYTLVSEDAFLAFLADAGYTVTRSAAS